MDRKWTIKQLNEQAAKSTSIRQLILSLGLRPTGGNYQQMHKMISLHQIDTAHFLGQGWNILSKNLKRTSFTLEDVTTIHSSYQSYKLRNRLVKEGLKTLECERCGWAEMSKDGRVPVELHHKNGKHDDNRLANLEILCPNCHSVEDTHRGRNIKR